MWVWLILILLLLVFIIYRLTRSYIPEIHYNPNGHIKGQILRMESLKTPYRPTPWLFNGHLQSIYGLRFRPSSKLIPRRQSHVYKDEGTAIYDWFEPPNCTPDAPVIIIIHTLAGGTREPCTNNMAECGYRRGFRVVVFNQRGCSGAPMTSPRPHNFRDLDDFNELLQIINAEFTPKKIFAVGFSLGAYVAANMATVSTGIDAYVCISHTCNAIEASKIIQTPIKKRLYLKVLLSKLQKMCERAKKFIDTKPAYSCKSLEEFDDLYTIKYLGYSSHEEYYKEVSIPGKCKNALKPLMLIASLDDPFTDKSFYPIDEIEESDQAAMVLVPEGGHVSFLAGINAGTAYYENIVLDWFKVNS